MISQTSYRGCYLKLKTKIAVAVQNFFLKYLGSIAPQLVRLIGEYPYIIKLDVTEDCNLTCKMCYAKKHHPVPLKNIFSILDQIGNVSLRLDLLGGEPLLRNDLDQIISYAKKHTGISEITLYTNGTLATEERVNKLYSVGLNKAIVSLVSHDKNTHNNFVGADDAWQKTICGIRNFKAAGIETYTFTALHNDNIDFLDQIYQFVTQELKVSPLFYQYIPQRNNDPLLPSSEKWHECKHKILYNYSPKHTDFFINVINCCQTICLGGKYAISIKVDGNVTPCPFIHDLVLGNVYQQSIWDILAQKNRMKSFQEFTTLPSECATCTYKNLCAGGCRAGNKIKFNSYLTRDCRCLGPYHDTLENSKIADRMPTFF